MGAAMHLEAKLARKTVYLSGPIMDASSGEAVVWRETAKGFLGPYFRLLDPMRRNFQDRLVDSANEIVEFDLQDIREADIVLVNYCKPSIGTSMEVFYAAHDCGKFVVTFSPFTFAHCSPWMVRYSTKILPSLDAACDYVLTHFNESESQ
jgi:nucleoside 2-deoxyribosyltransferase